MRKAIDETWRVGNRVPRHIYRGDGPGDVVGTLDREEDARLAAAAPEALRLLLAEEWEAGRDYAECISCRRRRDDQGHAANCVLDALLRKAGLR